MAVKSSNPKYIQIAEHLRKAIASGTYSTGDKLPPERELAAEYSVALLTLRQGLKVLEEEGILRRRHGHGTFVQNTIPDSHLQGRNEAQVHNALLLGIVPQGSEQHDPVNWQVKLRIYEGIMNAGFECGINVRSPRQLTESMGREEMIDTPEFEAELARIDGILIHSDNLPEKTLFRLQQSGKPVVAINCNAESAYCSKVLVDMRKGSFDAVQYLVASGHRRIGLIVGDQKSNRMRQRYEGYCWALEEAGLELDHNLVVFEHEGLRERGREATCKLLNLGAPPTAIFTASGLRALGARDAIQEKGLSLPEDISLISYDRLDDLQASDEGITSLDNPLFEMGAEAVRLLGSHLEQNDNTPKLKVLDMEILERGSVAQLEPALAQTNETKGEMT